MIDELGRMAREIRFAITEVSAFISRAAAEKLPSRATRRNALMLRMVFTPLPLTLDREDEA